MPSPSQFYPPSMTEISNFLPEFQFHSILAKGRLGAIYHATQKANGHAVAIKILSRDFIRDTPFYIAFAAKNKSMVQLRHPNLISISDFGELNGMPYSVCEHVEGKSLNETAKGRKVNPAKSIEILLSLCSGVEHAHAHGIFFSDLKPADIFITKNGEVKIGDFSQIHSTLNKESGIIIFTPGYSAPEVLADPKHLGEHAAIYSLAAIFYELLTGHIPDALYESVVNFSDCDPAFDLVLRKALHPHPSERYPTVHSFASAIQALPKVSKKIETLPSAQGSTLLTPEPSTPASILTPHTARFTTPLASSTTAPIQVHFNQKPSHSLFRNFIIILILLIAIFFTYDQLLKKKQRIQHSHDEIETPPTAHPK